MFGTSREEGSMDRHVTQQTRVERHRVALAAAKASPTQHTPRLARADEARLEVHGASPLGRCNDATC